MATNTQPRVAFVTGATGFVGLNIVDDLLGKGWIVHALHRPGSSRARMLTELPNATRTGSTGVLHLVEGELLAHVESFAELVPRSTEVIFHICHVGENISDPLRQVSAPGFSREGAEEHRRLNINAMENIIFAAARHSVRRIVFCSSWSAYGFQHPGTCVTESTSSTANEPVSDKCCCIGAPAEEVPYFASKAELERLLCKAQENHTVQEAVIIQPCSIFGRFGTEGWCKLFFRLAATGGKLPGLPGASSFTDVQDLAAAFVTAADAGPGKGERYIIGGTNETNMTMLSEMAKLVGTPAPTRATPPHLLVALSKWNEMLIRFPWPLHKLRVKPNVIGSPWLIRKIIQNQWTESKAAQRVLNYRPRSLASTLKRNFDWLVSSGEWAKSSKDKNVTKSE